MSRGGFITALRTAMKLNILSDLHLSLGPLDPPENDADAVVLAGDVARPKEAVNWASRLGKPVFYVTGNHEFYGGTIAGTVAELKHLCAGTNVHVLDNEEVFFEGVRILGTTLWTDFLLFGTGDKRAAALDQIGLRFARVEWYRSAVPLTATNSYPPAMPK